MNLTTHSNIYAYLISHIKSKGTETVIKYTRESRQYSVCRFINWTCTEEFNTNSAYIAKQVFRSWI